jgi:small-conductance mechanosensitive channel
MCGFSDSSLNLELIAFVHDVDTVKSVTSDLCFAIHDAFRRRAIQISYPHRDLRLSLDDEQLKRIFDGGRAVG